MSTIAAPLTIFTAPDAITAAAGKPFDLRLGVKVEKVDKDKRLVRGRATAEVLDAHGEVVDYETAKAAFATWKGNIREMHQPIAVGKAVDIECVDATREIFVTAYVSKGAPATWEKVLDGTLSEYSIGARAIAKTEKFDGKPATKLYLTKVNETSLVDAGACPGSSFDIVKMEGGEPVMAQELTAEEQAADPAAGDTATDATADTAEPTAEATAEKTVVVSTKSDVLALLALPATERVQKFNALTLDVDVEKRMESYDIRTALSAISCLQELVASEYWDAKYAEQDGRAADPEGPAQIQMLRDATELVLAFLISEFMAQFDDEPASALKVVDGVKSIESQTRVAGVAGAIGLLFTAIGQQPHATPAAAAPAAPAEVPAEKAAATTIPTGGASAQSDAPTPSTPAAESAASSDTDATVAKLEGLVSETTKALTQAQDTIRAQADSMSALQTRLEKLEAQPMPGGPVTRAMGTAVTKTIGSDAVDAIDAADPAEVIKVLQDMANDPACTPAERERIAHKLLTFQMKTGAGRAVIQRPGA
jgi:hypothetical protein